MFRVIFFRDHVGYHTMSIDAHESCLTQHTATIFARTTLTSLLATLQCDDYVVVERTLHTLCRIPGEILATLIDASSIPELALQRLSFLCCCARTEKMRYDATVIFAAFSHAMSRPQESAFRVTSPSVMLAIRVS